jgi:hypothetical protein
MCLRRLQAMLEGTEGVSMHSPTRSLIALAGCLLVALVLASGARPVPSPIQTTSYQWVQPWSAPTAAQTWVQPPSWITAGW